MSTRFSRFGVVATFSLCSACTAAPPAGSSEAALSGPADALGAVQAGLRVRVDQILGQLPKEDQAALIDELAWYDENPRELYADRGSRGQVQRLRARFLAHPITPDPPITEDPARIEKFFEEELGAELLALGPDDDLAVVATRPRADGGLRYVLIHQAHGHPVDGAALLADVDSLGRLVGMTSNLVPDLQPPSGTFLAEPDARDVAQQAVLAAELFGWQGATSFDEPESPSVRVAPTTSGTHVDDARFVWRFVIDRGDGQLASRVEVLVDALDGSVLEVRDHARLMLDSRDEIIQLDGTIGGPLKFGGPLFSWDGSEDPCTMTTSPPPDPTMSTVAQRDLDETKVALCRAVELISTYGSALPGGWRSWIDPRGEGLHIGIGATPGLSVGLNSGGRIALAGGVGRAEIIGHELFHSVLADHGPGSGLHYDWYGSASLPAVERTGFREAEGGAIEEHLGDVFGSLVERSFAPQRNEDPCLMNDDVDSTTAQGMQDLDPANLGQAYRPCADEMIAREWRSLCDPTQQNSGWCSGAAHYGDLGYNIYDTYGRTAGNTVHVASHTDLGVGNRLWSALRSEDVGYTRFEIEGVSEEMVTELLFELALRLGPDTDWARYGGDMISAAITRDPGPTTEVGSLEAGVRAGLASMGVWSSPRDIVPELSGTPQAIAPTALDRPAAASVELPGPARGGQRTFVFYRASDAATTLSYVWRDEPRSDEATLGTSWTGPCPLPGATSRTGAAATGRADALFVAWAEPTTADPAVGVLRGLSLSSEDAAAGSGCSFAWAPTNPPVERRVRGQPAIVSWTPAPKDLTCDNLGIGVSTPGVIGPGDLDCFEFLGVTPPWTRRPVDVLEPYMESWVRGFLNDEGPRFAPEFDPQAPRRRGGVHHQRVPVWPAVQASEALQKQFADLPEVGPLFAESFQEAGGLRAMGGELVLPWSVSWSNGVPQGELKSISLVLAEEVVMLAFRDESGALRLAPYDDLRPTASLPLVDASPTSDPALAVTQAHRVSDDLRRAVPYLHVLYGTSEVVGGAPVPTRLSQRTVRRWELDAAPFAATDMEPAQRLDTFDSATDEGRRINYQLLRTLQAPVAVGAEDVLHVFVVGLERDPTERDHAPDSDLWDRQYDADYDRVLHATLAVGDDGIVVPVSERPVRLTRTALSTDGYAYGNAGLRRDEMHPLNRTQAGAALATERGFVRWLYPTRRTLTARTVWSR